MTARVERGEYEGFGPCVRVANGAAELAVTTGFGPRVIHYALAGRSNVMFTNAARINLKSGPDFDRAYYPGAYWDIYGGNRLWVAPESTPETFYPDHEPVEVEVLEDGAAFRSPPQRRNEVQLGMQVALAADSSRVSIRYAVTNTGSRTRVLAPWSVTALDAGGIEIIPQPRDAAGVLPNRRIALWDYSDMSDERVYWGKRFITLRQIPHMPGAIKIGINNSAGWGCYLNRGTGFVCRYEHLPHETYADFGVSYESYANEWYVELESMAPLRPLAPGETAYHREEWELFVTDAAPAANDEAAIAALVERYVEPAGPAATKP